MPAAYTSIFDGPNLITKKKLCQLLNLDTSRPGLLFSPAEIEKAYKKRALRFHPDAQLKHPEAIPVNICNILMNDITRARDHLLRNEDNIPGKAFVENWVDHIIKALNEIQSNTANTLSANIRWLSSFSNGFSIVLLLSTFSNGALNFRYVSAFSAQLDLIRPYIRNISDAQIAVILHKIKANLDAPNPVVDPAIMAQLKAILPQDLSEEKIDALLTAIQVAGKKLKNVLTDDSIENLQHIIHFWAQFAAEVPAWRHILAVFFVSLLFTSTSLPQYFNANKTIAKVIWEHKGPIAFVFASLPLFALSCALFPLNIAMHLGMPLAWIALNASFQLLMNGLQLVSAAIKSLFSVFNAHFAQNAFAVFKSIVNITIRIPVNTLIEVLDATIHILCNHSMLSSLQSSFNSWLDSILDSLGPKTTKAVPEPLFQIAAIEEERKSEAAGGNQASSFFANASVHNAVEDLWLKELLSNLSVENDALHEPCEAAVVNGMR